MPTGTRTRSRTQTQTATLICNTDGSCSGNPGPAGIGVVAYWQGREDEGTVIELSEYIGQGTNNLAEFRAVKRALEEALLLGALRVAIQCDSLIVVRQIENAWKCNASSLRLERNAIQALMSQFTEGASIVHIYDEHNGEADRLARAATRRGRG